MTKAAKSLRARLVPAQVSLGGSRAAGGSPAAGELGVDACDLGPHTGTPGEAALMTAGMGLGFLQTSFSRQAVKPICTDRLERKPRAEDMTRLWLRSRAPSRAKTPWDV